MESIPDMKNYFSVPPSMVAKILQEKHWELMLTPPPEHVYLMGNTHVIKPPDSLMTIASRAELMNNIFKEEDTTFHTPFSPYKSLKDLIYDFYAQSFTFRAVTFGSVFILAYLLWKYTSRLLDKRRHHMELEHIKMRIAYRRRNRWLSMLQEENMCVVCLSCERQVMAVNCGHFCVCAECADNLPVPKKCPICKAHVKHFLPYFDSGIPNLLDVTSRGESPHSRLSRKNSSFIFE